MESGLVEFVYGKTHSHGEETTPGITSSIRRTGIKRIEILWILTSASGCKTTLKRNVPENVTGQKKIQNPVERHPGKDGL